jgi:deoxyribodipyrimidine photolyase
MNIFIFNRGLRLTDNTTLIHQIKEKGSVVPIFIFTPEQIDPKQNDYFSNNSVQFMIESLHELSDAIKKKGGHMYFLKGDNVKVLKAIHRRGLNLSEQILIIRLMLGKEVMIYRSFVRRRG